MNDTIITTNSDSKLNFNINIKSLFLFALPTILSMVLMNIYVTVDGVWVSNLIDSNALAGLNITYPVISIVLALGLMIATGGVAIIGRKLGQGRELEARQNFTLIVAVGAIVGVVFTVICGLFLEDIVYLLGADESTFEYCMEYLGAYLFFITPTFMNVIFHNLSIVAGKAKLGLFISTLGGIFNIIFDYVLIAPCGLGIAGAAIASGLGFCFAPLFFLIYFSFNKKGALHFVVPKLDFKMIGHSCLNGCSEMIGNLSFAITTFLYNITLMQLVGSTGVAAITIILYAMNLLMSVFLGYSIGVSSVISYNYGKQNHDNLHKAVKNSIIIVSIIAIVTFISSLIFADFLVLIFEQSDATLMQMATDGFRIFSIGFIFMSLNIFASNMFTALSNGPVSGLLAAVRSLIFTVIFIIVMPCFFGVTGVWLANPLAEFSAYIITIVFLLLNRKKYNY